MLDLIAIGDSLVDIFFILDPKSPDVALDLKKCQLGLHYASKIPIEKSYHSVGGNAANVAVGTATLGLQTSICTEVGDDINAHHIVETFEDAGVKTNLVHMHKGKETRYSVVLNYKGERTILSYHAEREYKLRRLPKTKWIYYTSLGKGFEKLQKELLAHLRKHPETRLAMNPGSHQMAHGLPHIRKMMPHVDVLLVNKEEAIALVGKNRNIKRLFKDLHAMGAKMIVITDGDVGSYASNGTDIFFMKPYPIKASAKTGAGDAYTSGFLSATILGHCMEDAMMWGTANAGGVIQKVGAQEGLQTRRGIARILRKHKTTPKKL